MSKSNAHCSLKVQAKSVRLCPHLFRQVEALAVRLRCRLVKLSPGSLFAAAGVQADRYDVFQYVW